jgi:Domain of Unknown Function (DUF1543)
MNAMKLFMVQVGGGVAHANTELHDIRFTIGAMIEDCYEDLRSQWWGDPKTLHLDCWGVVDQADGYDVEIAVEARPASRLRLFFVNLGGYDPAEFGELHRNVLVVERDAPAAKIKALRSVSAWRQPHRDKLFEVETAVDVGASTAKAGCALRLNRSQVEQPFQFNCKYVAIGRMAAS